MPQRAYFGRPIVERRQVERRKVHTMLDPSIERRKVRRRLKRPKTLKITGTQLVSTPTTKSDRRNILIAVGLFLIAIECWFVSVLRFS